MAETNKNRKVLSFLVGIPLSWLIEDKSNLCSAPTSAVLVEQILDEKAFKEENEELKIKFLIVSA